MDTFLPSGTMLLHAVAAAALSLVGVVAARWLGVVRSLPPGLVGRLGWVLGVAAVAVGGLVHGVYVELTTEASFGWMAYVPIGGEGSYEPLDEVGLPLPGQGASPFLVLLGAPLLALAWAAAAVRGVRRHTDGHPAAPPALVAQAAGVWAVTLPLQAALCAWEVQGPLVGLGGVIGLAGALAVASGRPTGTDVGDVLAATGVWLVAAATWPGPTTYAGPLVAATLVVVRRGRRAAS